MVAAGQHACDHQFRCVLPVRRKLRVRKQVSRCIVEKPVELGARRAYFCRESIHYGLVPHGILVREMDLNRHVRGPCGPAEVPHHQAPSPAYRDAKRFGPSGIAGTTQSPLTRITRTPAGRFPMWPSSRKPTSLPDKTMGWASGTITQGCCALTSAATPKSDAAHRTPTTIRVRIDMAFPPIDMIDCSTS